MANINLSKVYHHERFEGFGGIGCKAGGGRIGIADLKNFRINPDGSLAKRTGFSQVLTLPEGKLRAIHAISDTTVFALIGPSIYKIDTENAVCTLLATMTESDSEASFFNYGDALYLIDGTEIYVYLDEEWLAAEGYVPLYGNDWNPDTRGEVNEPLNLLSSRMRIRYRVRDSSTISLSVPYGIDSLDAVYINGMIADPSSFSWRPSSYTLNATSTLRLGDIVEIWFSPSVSYIKMARQMAKQNTRAATYGGGTNGAEPSSLALYGGERPNEIFVSRRVDPASYNQVKQVYNDAAPLYIVDSDILSIDNGNASITATCQSGPNLAVFTEGSTFLLTEGSDGTSKLITISANSGCAQKDGAISLDNAPVAASASQILYWEPSVLYDNEYTAKSISSPIESMLPKDTSKGCAAFFRSKNEIWFYFGDGGRIWVYNTSIKAWYSFTGFTPDVLFALGNRMAFVSGSTVYVMRDGIFFDNGKPIEAVIESDVIPFGEINRKKRISRAMLSFSTNEEVKLTVTNDEGNTIEKFLCDELGGIRGYAESRLFCPRSRYYSFSLSHIGGDVRIYSLILSAVK